MKRRYKLTSVHPQTTARLSIGHGDRVLVATKRGRIRQQTILSGDMDPRVVDVDYVWWFLENGAETQYGWRESNINILTADRPPIAEK